jgi:hypothetical protein
MRRYFRFFPFPRSMEDLVVIRPSHLLISGSFMNWHFQEGGGAVKRNAYSSNKNVKKP